MICDKCGYNNNDTIKSCRNCGTKLKSINERDMQRILNRAADASEPADFSISILDRINACISFASIPVLLVFLVLSSADIIQYICIPLFSAVSGLIAISPTFAKTMVTIKGWPFNYSGNSGKIVRKLLSWGLLATTVISTLIIFFDYKA